MSDKAPFPHRTLAVAFIFGMGMWAPMFAVPPLEYLISRELNVSHTQAGFLFTIPVIMVAALSIPWGILTDRVGFRKMAGIGGIILVAGAMLRATSTNYASLLGFTVLYGLGFSMVLPNLLKMVSISVPRDKAAVATGLYGAGITIGSAVPLSITASTILPAVGTLQGVMFVWSLPALVTTIIWWAVVREPQITAPATGNPARAHPSLQVLANKNLWLVAILLFLQNSFFYIWTGWTPALIMERGATPELAGSIASVALWACLPTFFFAPWLSSRLGSRKLFIWLPSFLLLLPMTATLFMTVTMAWVLMALIGLLQSARFLMLLALPAEMMPKEVVGAASGLILSIGYIGALAAPMVGGRIFDLTGSLNLAVVFVIAITLLMGILATRVPETGTKAATR